MKGERAGRDFLLYIYLYSLIFEQDKCLTYSKIIIFIYSEKCIVKKMVRENFLEEMSVSFM